VTILLKILCSTQKSSKHIYYWELHQAFKLTFLVHLIASCADIKMGNNLCGHTKLTQTIHQCHVKHSENK